MPNSETEPNSTQLNCRVELSRAVWPGLNSGSPKIPHVLLENSKDIPDSKGYYLLYSTILICDCPYDCYQSECIIMQYLVEHNIMIIS